MSSVKFDFVEYAVRAAAGLVYWQVDSPVASRRSAADALRSAQARGDRSPGPAQPPTTALAGLTG
jgi:hypothetical protein